MSTTTAATNSPERHAHFQTNLGQETKRKKILTIRYGKNQMALIRKRLRVEAWLYDTLEMLTQEQRVSKQEQRNGVENGNDQNAEIDIDIDQMLDVEGDCERRQWLEEKLKDCLASREIINTFIDDLLERLKTL